MLYASTSASITVRPHQMAGSERNVPFGGRPPGAATAQSLSRFCSRSRRCDHLITEVCFSGRIIINRSWSGRESGPKSVTSINDEHLPAERRSPLTHQTPLIARGSSAFGHCLLSADQRLAPSTELEEGLDQEGLRRRTKRISFHAPVHKPARNTDRSCSSADRASLGRLRKTRYARRIAPPRPATRHTVRMQS